MSVVANVMTSARRGNGMYRHAKPLWRRLQGIRVPVIPAVAAALYAERELRGYFWQLFLKIIYREPLLRYRCARVGNRLEMWNQLPLIYGSGRIELGDDVTIYGRNTWTVGYKVSEDPALIVGNRVTIGYAVTMSIATRVEIGDDTMIASGVQIYDNITHPLSPARRLRKESFNLSEAAPVIIGRNVWIGSNAVIMRGVTIGDNSIVSTGAVVRRAVPPNTVVDGNPARVILPLTDES